MNVQQVIDMLSDMEPTTEVLSWDPVIDEWAPVTGAVYSTLAVRLYTDDDDAEEEAG